MKLAKLVVAPLQFVRTSLAGFAGFGAATLLDRASRLSTSLVAAGLLGPEQWGIWFVINLALLYGTLSSLGSTNGMNLEVPTALGQNDKAGADRLQAASAGVLVASLSIIWIGTICFLVLRPPPFDSTLVLATLGLLTARQLQVFGLTALKARDRFDAVSRVQAIAAFFFPLVVLPATATLGLLGFVAAQTIHYLATCVVLAVMDRTIYRIGFDRASIAKTIRTGLPLVLSATAFVLFSTADRWVILATSTPTALGHYSLAILTLGAISLVPQVVAQRTYPQMAFAWARSGSRDSLRTVVIRQVRASLTLVVPFVLVICLVAPSAVGRFLPEYQPGVVPLLLTLTAPLAFSLGQPFGSVLHVVGKRTLYLGIVLLAALANLGVSVALVDPLGLAGVALGTVFGYTTLTAALIVTGSRFLRSQHASY